MLRGEGPCPSAPLGSRLRGNDGYVARSRYAGGSRYPGAEGMGSRFLGNDGNVEGRGTLPVGPSGFPPPRERRLGEQERRGSRPHPVSSTGRLSVLSRRGRGGGQRGVTPYLTLSPLPSRERKGSHPHPVSSTGQALSPLPSRERKGSHPHPVSSTGQALSPLPSWGDTGPEYGAGFSPLPEGEEGEQRWRQVGRWRGFLR